MSKPSFAVKNLRAVVILIVIAFHSVLAYLGSLPPTPFAFDAPPYKWRAFPIVDSQRWFGFDIFCAHQDLYLITLMFFLSGLFVWPSLTRKGAPSFVVDRLLRLGLPFALTVGVLMPIAHYPVYAQTAVDSSIGAYLQHLLALPLWPVGPPWFLWVLLVFDIAAVIIYFIAPGRVSAIVGRSVQPRTIVLGLLAGSALAYIPMALAFGPWDWAQIGPFGWQLSRPLHYALYFFGGVFVGARGLDHGLLAPEGLLARRWRLWLLAAGASFVAWLGCAGLAMAGVGPALLTDALQAISFVLAAGTNSFLALGLAIRFLNAPKPKLDFFSTHAYGLYLVHYLFVIWLQYLLLDVALAAVLKALLVFSGTLVLTSASLLAFGRITAAIPILGSHRTLTQRSN